MPAIFPTGTNTLATLRSLAQRGDMFATALMAIMNNTYWPSLTAAAEAGDAIRVSGQVKDQDGQNVAAVKHVKVKATMAHTPKTEVALATAAALAAVTPAGTGVGHTLTADANGALTVDGVAAAAGMRVLVKNQVAGDDNGIYVVTDAGSGGTPFILTRATDFDAVGEMPYGASVYVRGGDTNAGKTFVHTTTAAITVDTTALTFADMDTLCSIGLGAAGATIKAKTGARELWVATSATGAFSVDVTGAAATIGDVLLEAVSDNGETELLVVTFA